MIDWPWSPKSKLFQDHLAQAAPEFLYHYTSQTGLISILKSGELWASKVQHMNDATEFKRALQLANECVTTKYRSEIVKDVKNTNGTSIRALFERFAEGRSGLDFANIFVTCFCCDGDQLGQWRGYSGQSHGYSLGLDSSDLESSGLAHGFRLGPCIYDEDRQREIVRELIDECMLLAPRQAPNELGVQLLMVGAFFKSPKFREEREWRLVSAPTDISGSMIDFRAGISAPVPYCRLPIGKAAKSAIQRVVIGPCPDYELSRAAVEAFAEHCDLELCRGEDFIRDIQKSEVPYRTW